MSGKENPENKGDLMNGADLQSLSISCNANWQVVKIDYLRKWVITKALYANYLPAKVVKFSNLI